MRRNVVYNARDKLGFGSIIRPAEGRELLEIIERKVPMFSLLRNGSLT